jgi:hypothetical protein
MFRIGRIRNVLVPAQILANGVVPDSRWGDPPRILARDFGVIGDGVHDDTAAIINAIQFLSFGTVDFTGLTACLLSNTIPLRSGINLVGDGVVFTYARSRSDYLVFVAGTDVSGVVIDGIVFDGLGHWSSTPFANPYAPGNSVGFTNAHDAINLANCANVQITNCEVKGVGRGFVVSVGRDIAITDNFLHNLGEAGIRLMFTTSVKVFRNRISGVYGQLTAPGDTTVDHSCFADGVYLYDVTGVEIANNPLIEDIVRIGVVLEGNAAPRNTDVEIHHNAFKNFHSCRGGQSNAGVWCEPALSIDALIHDNLFDNDGAILGWIAAHGVQADNCTLTNNRFINFNDVGIFGSDFIARNNILENNGFGLACYGRSTITGNTCIQNLYCGLFVNTAHGSVVIEDNTFIDNGQQPSPLYLKLFRSGISIDPYYNDQHTTINRNIFVSSANEGDFRGQLYAIADVSGGDLPYDKSLITNCSFTFTGTFATLYPASMHVAPCSFARIDGGTEAVVVDEVLNVDGNVNGKIPA